MITDDDVSRVAEAATRLSRVSGGYVESDFVTNLFETVLDFMMRTDSVTRAIEYYRGTLFDEIRTRDDLDQVMARFADDKEGNLGLAQFLWNNRHWTRAGLLRRLVEFFDSIGVRDQDALRDWAARAEFTRDFQGRIKGLGEAVFQALVMRQGVDTVKPDVHVHRFVESAIGRRLSDAETVQVVSAAARRLGWKAAELDWSIWEHGRAGGGSHRDGVRPD
jgi:hypothetical protein